MDRLRHACRWVIGCDGAHSAVRKATGIPFAGSTYRDEFIMADAELDWQLPHGGIYGFPALQEFSRPSPCLARTVTGSSATSRQGQRSGSRVQRTQHEEFQAMVDERVPSAPRSSRSTGDPLPVHSRTVPRYRDGRVFLVGDAATCTAPRVPKAEHRYSGRLQPGLEARACRIRLADDELLDTYQAERHPVGVQLLKTPTGCSRSSAAEPAGTAGQGRWPR